MSDARAPVEADALRQRTEALLGHPYQRFCGLELIEQGAGTCVTRLSVRPNVTNLADNLHGGVIYSMADVTCMLATLTLLGADEYAVSHSVQLAVLSPVGRGDEVTFEAEVLRRGRSLVFAQCGAWKLRDGRRQPVATGTIIKSMLLNTKGGMTR
ncbi:PaaI family thioesterase [Sorangium sp. So ce134]